MVRALRAFLVPLTLVAPVFAQASPPVESKYSLAWVRAEGAEICPPARALGAEVERRLGRAVFDADAPRGFEVEVTRFGGKYRSDVFVRGPGGEMLGHRTLESDEPGCSALLNATALAIALVIDPDAASREPPPPQSSGAFEAAPEPSASAAPPAPVLAPPSPAALPPARVPVPAPEPLDSVTLSVRGALQLGLVPSAAPGVALAFSLRPARRWGFAVQAEYTAPREATQGIGALEIGLTRATASVTFDALRAGPARWVVGAGPSLGAFHVAVREPAPVTSPGDYWFSAVELATLLQADVSKGFFVELGAGALVALQRQDFLVRQQDEPVWSQPRISGSLMGGAGARFP